MSRLSVIARPVRILPVVLLVGCVDLVLEPSDQVSEDAFFQTIGDFRSAMIGIYDRMQRPDLYGRDLPLLPDIMGEDVKQNWAGGRLGLQDIANFSGATVFSGGTGTDTWSAAYAAINMMNMMINAAFEPPAGVRSEYDQLIGEAHAARALAHFDLVRLFAQHFTFTPDASHLGVPIVLESDPTNQPARNTVAEVYDQVIADFQAALLRMGTTGKGPFMLSREAVLALLSRVYLYKEDFGNAKIMADEVIHSGKFTLVTGSDYVTQFATGGSPEAIFEFEFSATDSNGSSSLGGMYLAQGYGDFLPARDLLDRISPDDIRAQMFIEDPVLVGIYAGKRMNKFPTLRADNIPVIRLSEVYLNRAEASVRSGEDAAARADLDLIRRRGRADAPAATSAGQELLNEILLERRIELGYEGHRVFDITRHCLDVVRSDCTGSVCSYTYPGPYFILPIPMEEMYANPNMVQNPGYRSR